MRIDSDILERVKELWGLSGNLEFIRKVANWIYYCSKKQVFVRLTEESHRSLEQIESELDWMFHLQAHGVHFAHPVRSLSNSYCELLCSSCSDKTQDQKYIVTVFKQAPGKRLLEKEQFNSHILKEWGRLFGKIHSASKLYEPSVGVARRVEWNQEEYHQDILELLSPGHGKIYDEFRKLENVLHKLPKDVDGYGLIHGDLHTGNFNVDSQNRMTCFDFDDCVYSWFIYDLVIAYWSLDRFELDSKFILDNLLSEYSEFNELDQRWIDLIPEFYSYRLILIHYFCMKSLQKLDTDESSRDWMQQKIDETRFYFDSQA